MIKPIQIPTYLSLRLGDELATILQAFSLDDPNSGRPVGTIRKTSSGRFKADAEEHGGKLSGLEAVDEDTLQKAWEKIGDLARRGELKLID